MRFYYLSYLKLSARFFYFDNNEAFLATNVGTHVSLSFPLVAEACRVRSLLEVGEERADNGTRGIVVRDGHVHRGLVFVLRLRTRDLLVVLKHFLKGMWKMFILLSVLGEGRGTLGLTAQRLLLHI